MYKPKGGISIGLLGGLLDYWTPQAPKVSTFLSTGVYWHTPTLFIHLNIPNKIKNKTERLIISNDHKPLILLKDKI